MSSLLSSYEPPAWIPKTLKIPTHRLKLANLPTPVQPWTINGPEGFQFFVKRDDLSGMEVSGNKIRKLEFLLAEAVRDGYSSVITIGGIQSNHARATAAAACSLGLDSHLILRTSAGYNDPGVAGNLLVERMVGAKIHLVSVDDYRRIGSDNLVAKLQSQLATKGEKSFPIPVGGSNGLGTWGYIETISEIKQQIDSHQLPPISDIVFACGSGGTAAGLALGAFLSGMNVRVHGVMVCDDKEYFHNHVNHIFKEMGVDESIKSENILNLVEGFIGRGYALNTEEELKFVMEIAKSSGILLDPVYSGKAAFGMVQTAQLRRDEYKGTNVLFIHTGGMLSLFAKADEMAALFPKEEITKLNIE